MFNTLLGRWQFRLSTLLIGIAILAVTLSMTFAIGPLLIDDWKLVSGYLHLHLTPAAQQLFFDPPAPMGPMHETKVIGVKTLASRAFLLMVMLVVATILFARRQLPRQ